MDTQLYEKCLAEERELQFACVTQNEMLKLGLTIHENNAHFDGPLAIRIEINSKEVFSFYPDGTGLFHEMWLERKANLVAVQEMSSLRAFLELEKDGESLEKDWNLDPKTYAACGGGFPIRLKDGCVVGSVCVSGLPHLQDHRAVIEGITLYLAAKRMNVESDSCATSLLY